MAFIHTVPEQEANGRLREIYRDDRDQRGYLPNYTRAFSLRPEAYLAWKQLGAAIQGPMDLRRYVLVNLAAARAMRSSYCSLALGDLLRRRFVGDDEVVALMRDTRDAELSDAEVAMMQFAEKLTREPHRMTQRDVDGLRAHGFDDAEVLDIALAASFRNFFSRVLEAVGAEPDAAFHTLPPDVREALTVGRPIESDRSAEST